MEEIIKSIILGIVQGLAEFLPVSSSGHIELFKALFNVDFGKDNLLFTSLIHGATVLSTIVVFRKDIFEIIKTQIKFTKQEKRASKTTMSEAAAITQKFANSNPKINLYLYLQNRK